MGTSATVNASVRAATHRPGTSNLSDTNDLLVWQNEDYPRLRRRLADDVPDRFTAVSADIVVADGVSTINLLGAPVSLTDFEKLRSLEVKQGLDYVPLRWGSPLAASIGAGAAGTYRARYVTKAAVLVLGGTPSTLDWPDGMDRVLVEQLAARVRVKFNESPDQHLKAMESVYGEVRDALMRQYLSTPQTIVDVGGVASWPAFRLRGAGTIELVASP